MLSFIDVSDISKSRRLRLNVDGERLSPRHTVGQAIDDYLDEVAVDPGENRWTVIARGKRLDQKALLADIPEELSSWLVTPEVSAGAR